MKKKVYPSLLCAALCFSISSQATVIIDPSSGFSGDFEWVDGLGQIDKINGSANDINWSITAIQNSVMTFASTTDGGSLSGDEFSLVVDNVVTPWSSAFIDSSNYFHGILNNLYLSAGIHTITINVTKLSPGYSEGGAYVEFSGISAIPIPGAIWFFSSALIALHRFKRLQTNQLSIRR